MTAFLYLISSVAFTTNSLPSSRQSTIAYARRALIHAIDDYDSFAEEPAARAQLERLFRSGSTAEVATAEHAPAPPGVLLDLPLWRVQWVALPGHSQVLHVHVPHYVHLFELLVSSSTSDSAYGDLDDGSVTFGGDGPCFGHLLLPGGSANLDKPEAILKRGTRAPTIGTLMRLREVRRVGDGRLAVHAEAVGRFRVLRGTQASPYSKADVALLVDAEETAEWMSAVEPMHNSTAARLAAARAAATASAAVWARHEAAEVDGDVGVQDLAPINLAIDEPSCVAEANAAALAAARAAGEPAAMAQLEALDDVGETLSFEAPQWGPWRELLADTDEDTEKEQQQQQQEEDEEEEEEQQQPSQQQQEPQPSAPAAVRSSPAERLLRIEQQCWSELIASLRLARRLREPSGAFQAVPEAEAEVDLPEPLRMLLPPPPQGGWPAGAPTAPLPVAWLARYPPLRRAQRLSFQVAVLLPDLDQQKLLQCSSTAGRLEDALYLLREMSGRLAALAALKATGSGELFGGEPGSA